MVPDFELGRPDPMGRVVHRGRDLLRAPGGAVASLRRSYVSEEPVGETLFLTYDLDAEETVAWPRACLRRWHHDAPAAFPPRTGGPAHPTGRPLSR